MSHVFEQPGVPIIEIMRAATKWIGEQIVRWQPGAYPSSHGHFETVYGNASTGGALVTDEASDSATYAMTWTVRQPDNTIRTYAVSVQICGATEPAAPGKDSIEAPRPEPPDLDTSKD
jgi:hypothetical protein